MKKFPNWLKLVLSGITIGIINGFFGGGGGMIAVPVLEKALKLKTKSAHATAILIILPISVLSAIMYIIKGYFPVKTGISTAVGVIGGGMLGAFLLSKLNNKAIRIIFAILMVGLGIKMLFFP